MARGSDRLVPDAGGRVSIGWRRAQAPPLRSGITQLKFSSDGKHVLAQDAASAYVLTREPFANLFRIDAVDADPAQFTPDSKSIVFSNPTLRIESWNNAEQKRSWAYEMKLREPCVQHFVSPDGQELTCVKLRRTEGRTAFVPLAFDLVLYAVAKQTEIIRKEQLHGARIRFGGNGHLAFPNAGHQQKRGRVEVFGGRAVLHRGRLERTFWIRSYGAQ